MTDSPGGTRSLELFAPAKVNLGLRITGRRPDGYHELDSLFAPLDFGDDLRLDVSAADATEIQLRVLGDGDGIPDGPENLAARAARRYLEACGTRFRVSITLTKRIPAGAGLGGGSSDAAAVLRGLARLAPGLPETGLAELALALGADVPFFLDPAPCRVRGIGDQIEPLAGIPALALLLVHPGEALGTADVYQAFDALTPRPPPPRPPEGAWPRSNDALGARLHNDLEPAALRLAPSLGRIRRGLEALGAQAVAMSGSGATLYGIFPDASAASTAQAQGNFPWSRVASTRESR